jgi:hypothetical protein
MFILDLVNRSDPVFKKQEESLNAHLFCMRRGNMNEKACHNHPFRQPYQNESNPEQYQRSPFGPSYVIILTQANSG